MAAYTSAEVHRRTAAHVGGMLVLAAVDGSRRGDLDRLSEHLHDANHPLGGNSELRSLLTQWWDEDPQPTRVEIHYSTRTGEIESHTIGGYQDIQTGKLVPAGVGA